MFELSKILGHLLSPSVVTLILFVVGFCCCAVRRTSVIGRRLLMAGAAIVALATLPPSSWPLEVLEDRFPGPQALPPHVDGIIVLGGAINLGISAERGQPSLGSGADRMTGFLALAHALPDTKLIFTGGASTSEDVREADVARELFGELGLDLSRVIFERESLNTRENALFSKNLARPQPGETWLLVTSAVDMPRAVGCFRAVGWTVTPWPVGYRVVRSYHLVAPNIANDLANLDWATHEWLGLLYYWLRGWTDAWFPAPAPAPSSS